MSVSTPGAGFKSRTLSTIPVGEALTGDLDLRAALRGSVRVPSGWTAADITFQAREKTNTTSSNYAPTEWANVRAASGGGLVRITDIATDEDSWYPIPAEVFAHSFVRLRSTNPASESDVNQAQDMDLVVNVKTA